MSTQNYKGPIHLTKDMFDTLMSTGSVVDEHGVTHTYEDGHEYITDEIDYVDLESSQDVNGVKTFSDGIKLGSDGTTLTGVENNAPTSGSTKAITSGAVYSALSGKGTVSSVAIRNGSTSQGTISISGSPITSSGTIDVTLADNYGDTKNPYGSKTSNYVLAAPNGSNGVPSFRSLTFNGITNRGEEWLEWGGRNLAGSVSPIGMSLSNEHSANKIAFINGDCLSFEYSSDGGSTWTANTFSSSDKSKFCTQSYSVPIGRANASEEYTTNSRTRFTLTACDGTTSYLYTNPKKLLINVASSGSMNVLIEYRTGTNYKSGGAWTTFGTYALAGWSGWNDIPLVLSTLGGSPPQTANNWQLRLTFIMTGKNTSYPTTANVSSIRLYGANGWFVPSTLGTTGHLYSFDMSKNATFPANVSAALFTENGTSLSNKYQAKGNYAGSSTSGGAATSANKLNTNAGNPTQPVYFSNGIPVATTYSLAKSVPYDALFTDTNTWRKIQLNGVDKLGAATSTNPLNIVPGNYMSITESSGAFTFAVNADDIVTANPSGTGTTDLTKLKVGNTVYNIPSGGSNLPITVVDYSTSGVTFNFDDYTTPGLYFVTDYSFNNGPSFITTTSVDNSYTFWLEVEYDQSLNVVTQKVDFGNNIGIRSVAGDIWGTWSERNYGYIPTAVNSGTSITDLNKITINGTTYNVEKPPKLLTCSTTATTYSKTVSYTNFRLVTGSIITVKFTNAHNSSTAATLNVNSTGAKIIVWDNTGYTITASGDSSSKMNSWQAGEILTLAYDGSYWRIIARSKPVVYSATGNVPAVYNDFVEVAYFRAAAGKVYSVTANIQANIGISGTMGAYLEVYTPSGTQLAKYTVRGAMNAGGGLSISVISSDALSQTSGVYYRLKAYGYENATYDYYGYIQAVSVVE